MTTLRAVWIVACVVTLTLLLLPVHGIAMIARHPLRKRTALFWHRMVARIMGFRIHVDGHAHRSGPVGTLLVANHITWVDIIVIGSVAPLNFIAKDEVGTWPLFGWLARLQETVFVTRQKRTRTGQQINAVRDRLEQGDTLVLFPEGTTSCGNFVSPFNSSLFGAVTGKQAERRKPVPVQSVAIAYTGAGGMPMGRQWRPLAGWPGDITLPPHLMAVLRDGVFDITVAFGEPIADAAAHDRKALSARLEAEVRQMFANAIADGPAASKRDENPLNTRR
ncbi:MAG: lysophospholipid acyltransferase family protein [Pseudomonadota bacterium]